MAKTESPLTEAEVMQQARQEAINALRQWRVRIGSREEIVMGHQSALASGGVLIFYTHTDDGMVARNFFRRWSSCEEIVGPDGGKSSSVN